MRTAAARLTGRIGEERRVGRGAGTRTGLVLPPGSVSYPSSQGLEPMMPSAASEGSTDSGSPSGVSATVRSVRLSERTEPEATRRAAVARRGRALAPATRLRAAKPRAVVSHRPRPARRLSSRICRLQTHTVITHTARSPLQRIPSLLTTTGHTTYRRRQTLMTSHARPRRDPCDTGWAHVP
jgi:hypothetical protein